MVATHTNEAPTNSPTGLRRLPGLRGGSRWRAALLIAWTLVCAIGVVGGAASGGSTGIAAAAFYLVAYFVALGIARALAVRREHGEPQRIERRAERERLAREAALRREEEQRQAAVRREAEERLKREAALRREEEQRQAAVRREAEEREAAARRDAEERERKAVAERTAQEEQARRASEEAERGEAARRAALLVRLTPYETGLVRADHFRNELAAGAKLPELDPQGVVLEDGEVLLVRSNANSQSFGVRMCSTGAAGHLPLAIHSSLSGRLRLLRPSALPRKAAPATQRWRNGERSTSGNCS